MSNQDAQNLNDKIYANWQRFYREGRIDRRTLMRAAMVWAGAGSIGGLLAGCGGDDDEETPSGGGAATSAPSGATTAPSGAATAPAGATTAPSATEATGGEAAEGGTLRVILSESDLPTLDPHMHNLRTGIIAFYDVVTRTTTSASATARRARSSRGWPRAGRTSSRPSGRSSCARG